MLHGAIERCTATQSALLVCQALRALTLACANGGNATKKGISGKAGGGGAANALAVQTVSVSEELQAYTYRNVAPLGKEGEMERQGGGGREGDMD